MSVAKSTTVIMSTIIMIKIIKRPLLYSILNRKKYYLKWEEILKEEENGDIISKKD